MKSETHGRLQEKRKRQYAISLETLAELSRYCLESKQKQSEVVDVAVKEYLKKFVLRSMAFAAVMTGLAAKNLWAPGLTNVSESSIIQSIGNIIALISGIATPIVVSSGLLIGGIKYYNGDEDAMSYIKGGIVGGIICFSAWGLAKLVVSNF